MYNNNKVMSFKFDNDNEDNELTSPSQLQMYKCTIYSAV